MRWAVLWLTGLSLSACAGEGDPCVGPRTGTLAGYVHVHARDATTGASLNPNEGGDPQGPQGTISLTCPGFPEQMAKSWNFAIVCFVDPGPHNSAVTCIVTVSLPGYETWTSAVEQVYGQCGEGTKGYELQVDLKPAK